MKRLHAVLVVGISLAAAAPAAYAQTGKYPDRPIRLIAPFPPGGTIDVNARIIAPAASKSIGQQIVIDNRAGASGIIGTAEVARAKPDGYTLLINTLPIVTNTLMFSKVPYNVLKDFDFVSMLSSTPSFVSVHPSVPARSVRDLLKLARSRPGDINYASAGIGSNLHIAGELFNHLGKTNMVAIQFKGGGPALVGIISGETSVAFAGVAGGAAHATAGRLRALGVTSLQPSPALPGVPTIDQSGLPGYEFIAWFILAAPKGTPREAIATLHEHFRKGMSAPDTIKRLEADGIDVIGSTPEQASATLESELKKWATVIRERGMKAE
jgi:tripartite-type tricarboxylate transporter receptor subunit TctC